MRLPADARSALAALLLIATPAPGAGDRAAASGPEAPPESAAYVQRQTETVALYDELTVRLERAHATLLAATRERAPKLHTRLLDAPTEPTLQGYGLLPEIVADGEVTAANLRAISNRYSWPITRKMIERALARLPVELEKPIDTLPDDPPEARMTALEGLVTGYESLTTRHEKIGRHVEHNRLWQPWIHRDPAGYARATVLHDAVLSRDAIQRALDDGGEAAIRNALASADLDAGLPLAAAISTLRQREAQLGEEIRAAAHRPALHDFIVVEQSPALVTLRVPLYSDIPDPTFLNRVRESIERHWRIESGGRRFEVAIELRPIELAGLYATCTTKPACAPPTLGEPIDLHDHIAHFPADGAVLTTGAGAIHVLGARAMLLSPKDVAPRTLAHEFGHILGFRDEYIRGSRNLGDDGYEILEVVPSPEDIMASPGYGSVHRFHYEALLASPRPGARSDGSRPARSARIPRTARGPDGPVDRRTPTSKAEESNR